MENKQQPDLFNYLDYRHFLRDWLVSAKKHYGFSYRVFSRRAGLKSPSLYKMVMDGERDLIEGSLHKFLEGLSLSVKEKEYFATLVLYNQARTEEHKQRYLGKIRALREGVKAADAGSFRLSVRLSAENEDLIKSKIQEFCDEMVRLFGRRLESDKELVVTIATAEEGGGHES
ncbi:MAG TPA: TIGR02147 family protein [bacterium]|nr:TIGR02147 family protein [bacterium]